MVMDEPKLLQVKLNLFDGEGGGGAGDGAGTTGAEGTAETGTHEPIVYQKRNAKKTGDLGNVVYGKQTSSESSGAGSNEASDSGAEGESAEAKKARFQGLINGEFKDEFQNEFQTIFNRRFKDAKANEETLGKQKPIMDMLLTKYGISDGDMTKLSAAIENDNAMWQDAADYAGVDVETYKNQVKQQQTIKGLQEQLNAIKSQNQQTERQKAAEAQLQAWYDEGEALKETYPDFNFAAEIKNPQFQALLKAGTPVQHAYEVLHLNQIMANATARTEKRVTDSVRAKGRRPSENGMQAQSGIIYKTDVSKLSKKDRAEIAARAERGEMITF